MIGPLPKINGHEALWYNFAGMPLPYRLLYPKNYNPDIKYPVIMASHGSGGLGDNNTANVDSSWDFAYHISNPPRKNQADYDWTFLYDREDLECFVISPQIPPNPPFGVDFLYVANYGLGLVTVPYHPDWIAVNENGWYASGCFSLLYNLDQEDFKFYTTSGCNTTIDYYGNDTKNMIKPNIDRNRIYYTGFSYGGKACFEFLRQGREIFAGIIICDGWPIGRAYSNPVGDTVLMERLDKEVERWKHIPTLMVGGVSDMKDGMQAALDILINKGGKGYLCTNGGGHGWPLVERAWGSPLHFYPDTHPNDYKPHTFNTSNFGNVIFTQNPSDGIFMTGMEWLFRQNKQNNPEIEVDPYPNNDYNTDPSLIYKYIHEEERRYISVSESPNRFLLLPLIGKATLIIDGEEYILRSDNDVFFISHDDSEISFQSIGDEKTIPIKGTKKLHFVWRGIMEDRSIKSHKFEVFYSGSEEEKENLVPYGDFEGGWDDWNVSTGASFIPLPSQNNATSGSYYKGDSEMFMESDPYYDGGQYIRIVANSSFHVSSTAKHYINLIPGKSYKFTYKFKAPMGSRGQVGIYDLDYSVYDDDRTTKGYFLVKPIKQGDGTWQEASGVFTVPFFDKKGDPLIEHRFKIYAYGKTYTDQNVEVCYDSIQLYEHEMFLSTLLDDPESKILKFGENGDENNANIVYTSSSSNSLSDIQSESTNPYNPSSTEDLVYYRELTKYKYIYVDFPSDDFELDENGYPLDSFILEVGYKNDSTNDYSINRNNYHTIYSKLDYFAEMDDGSLDQRFFDEGSDDPLERESDKEYLTLTRLVSDPLDYMWKKQQISLRKTRFQIIRSIDGFFKFRILAAPDNPLKISYIALKKSTMEECETLNGLIRDNHKYVFIPRPEDGVVTGDESNCEIFIVDNDKPIHEHTKPSVSAVKDRIQTYGTAGEVEPISFGIYSKEGVENLNVVISDLVSDNNMISRDNVRLFEVTYQEVRTGPFARDYGVFPSKLEKLTTISVDADKSKRVWLKINIPSDAICGIYNGVITVSNNDIHKEIYVRFEVVNIDIVPKNILHSMYHDPFRKVFHHKTSEVLKFISEMHMTPFLYLRDTRHFDFNRETTTFDLSKFDDNFLIDMINTGVIDISYATPENKKEVILDPGIVYYWIDDADNNHPFYSTSNVDLWADMSSPETMEAMASLFGEIRRIGDKYNIEFIISMSDEPGTDPWKRIIVDRCFTAAHANGFRTSVTYYIGCDEPLEEVGIYDVPGGVIPPLTDLVDLKSWSPSQKHHPYMLHQTGDYHGEFGYYTTYHCNLRYPIYNRFLHGVFAYVTDTHLVSDYALGDIIGDPYFDFDRTRTIYQDFLLAFPTNDGSGEYIPTVGSEGIREGVKDLNLFNTLEGLIEKYPESLYAKEARVYLDRLKNNINTDYYYGYFNDRAGSEYYRKILKDISSGIGIDKVDTDDSFEVFSTLKKKIKSYIINIEKEIEMAEYYKVTYKTATELDPPAIRSLYTNYTSFADITKIQLAWEDIDGLDITGWLFSFAVDDFIQLTSSVDESEFGIYKVIILTNNTDSPTNPYIELEVVPTQINGVEYLPGTDNILVSHWNNSGTPGADGSSGTSGVDGAPGADGTSGTSGVDGAPGADGAQGADGAPGVDGSSGTSGIDGVSGPAGSDGVSGVDGSSGTSGTSGVDGEVGPAGIDGVAGVDGSSGTSGVSPLEAIDFDVIITHLEAIVEELKKK